MLMIRKDRSSIFVRVHPTESIQSLMHIEREPANLIRFDPAAFAGPPQVLVSSAGLRLANKSVPASAFPLWTDHEYISSVPKVLYADDNRPTRIDDEGVFASRTILRLSIGLGWQQLYTMSR
jgi:hypothetical protein